MVTIRDVAKASGFSVTTVSMVLNNAPLSKYIPARTKNVIQRAAKELHYHPNIFARSLRGRHTDTVGVIVFDITDPYCTHILRGIENELNEASLLYLLSDAQNNRKKFERSLELLLQRRVEGLILVANSLYMNPKVLESIRKPQVPVVVIGRNSSAEWASVTVDNQKGGYLALQHLYQLGHRQIAFVLGPKSIVDSELRWKGIEQFAKQAKLAIDEDLVIQLTDIPSAAAGIEAIKVLRRRKPFTAVLAFDDLTAVGVIRGLQEAGIQVPNGCSVIGFDDIDAAAYYSPPLTTIRQAMVQMGREGTQMLLALRTKKRLSHPHRLLEPELVVRSSTAKAM